MLPQKIFQIFGLRNAISCVFRRKFSVSKCEENIIYISRVGYSIYGKKGKAVTPLKEL